MNLFVLPEDRNGELFCYFVSFNLAYEYLEKIEPGSVLVKTPLDMKKEPRILRNRIPQSDYREILSVISGFTKKTDFTAMRAKSARKGLSIGLALSIPIAAVVGLTTLGLGSPLSMLIVGAGAGIGSACGAANPKELKKSFNEFNGYIENLNSTVLKEHGVFLVSPLVTNSFNNFFGISQNSARKVTHVKWIVKTLGSNCCGDPATAEEGKSPECLSDGDEDAYTSEDSDNDTITTSTTTTTTTNNNNNIEKRGEGTNSDSETDCSTSNDESSEDYPDSGSDLEDSVLNFINFDFNKDKNRKMMPLQKSKSTTSLSRVSKNSESNSSGPMGSRVGASSFTGVIVVSSDPSREGFRHEPDSRCAEDGEVLHEGAVETLEAEDASDNSSDDDIGYDSTFASDIKMKLIQKR